MWSSRRWWAADDVTAAEVVAAVGRIADVIDRQPLPEWADRLRASAPRFAEDDTLETRAELRRLLGDDPHHSADSLYVVRPDGAPDLARSRLHSEDVALVRRYVAEGSFRRWTRRMTGGS